MPGEPPLNPYEAPQTANPSPPSRSLNQAQFLGAMFGCVFALLCLAMVVVAVYFAFAFFFSILDIAPPD